MDKGLLRVEGFGNFQLRDVLRALNDLESAYNHILTFENDLAEIQRQQNQKVMKGRIPFYSHYLDQFNVPISSLVFPSERLIFVKAQISSPGWWEVLGKLNPLEVIRQWVSDAHERRKDRDYREPAEKERLGLDNLLHRSRVMRDWISTLKELGFEDLEIRGLLSQHFHEPLEKLQQHQTNGLLGTATLEPITDETESQR